MPTHLLAGVLFETELREGYPVGEVIRDRRVISDGVIRLDDVEEHQDQPSSVSQLRLASRARASVLRSDWAQLADDLTRLQRKAAGAVS